MKTKKYFFAILILSVLKNHSQTNIVPNPSFEDVSANFSCPHDVNDYLGNRMYFDWSNINGWTHLDCNSLFPCGIGGIGLGVAYWESYYCSGNVVNNARTGSANAVVEAYVSSSNTDGDYGYITTRLTEPLKTGHRYYIEYYIKPTTGYSTSGMAISALLTLEKPDQKRSYRIQTSVDFQGIRTTPTTFNGTNWLKVSGFFYASNAYEWLTLGCFDSANSLGAYVNGLFYIDDVKLIEKYYCNDICAPVLPAVLPRRYDAALQQYFPYSYPNSMSASTQPWVIYVLDAIGIDFTVIDRWTPANELFHARAFNVNGLKNPPFSDYEFLWRGKDDNGNYLPQGVYNYTIKIWNCVSEVNYSGSITYLYDGSNIGQIPFQSTPDLIDCCPASRYIQNTQYSNEANVYSKNFIIAGSNVTTGTIGPVIVNSSSGVVKYAATNNIQLQPGFTVVSGANFKAVIADDCNNRNAKLSYQTRPSNETIGGLKLSNNDSLTHFQNYSFFPNPSKDGLFTLKIADGVIFEKIEVFDIYCRLVLVYNKSEFNQVVDLTNQSSGFYTCRIYTEGAQPITMKLSKSE